LDLLANPLFSFPVAGVFVAKTAVFLDFHTVRVVLFFLGCVVVTLFAVCACQGDFCAHCFTSLCLIVGNYIAKKDTFVPRESITAFLDCVKDID